MPVEIKSDKEIITLILNGQSVELKHLTDELFTYLRPYNKCLANRYNQSQGIADVLLQESIHDFYLAFMEKRFTANPENGAAIAYLKGILRHKWSNYYKARKNIKKLVSEYKNNNRHELSVEFHKSIQPSKKKHIEKLSFALKQLKSQYPMYYRVLQEYWYEGLTIKEIALNSRKTESNIKKIHQRAKTKLKKLFARELKSD